MLEDRAADLIGDEKVEALFRAFGRFVNSLNGRYITAEDVGIDMEDMEGEEERVLLVVRVVVDDIRVHRVWRVLVVLVSLLLVLPR